MNKILVSAIILAIAGCESGEQASVEPITPSFQLTDTTGHTAVVFHSGDDFEMTYTVRNATDQVFTYHTSTSGPPIWFAILHNDSVLATSLDGYAFTEIPSTGYVQPGQILERSWRGPNTPVRDPQIFLTPGSYMIRGLFVGFDEIQVKQPAPIAFSIIE